MPPVLPPGSRVLVTGANGYLALYIVKNLLEDGYIVRGVVRSLEKGKQMQDIFKSHGDKLELAVVEDMLKDGAFDEVVKDVDAIEHTASPVNLSAVEPDDYIQPALRMTLGILESAFKSGNRVKRIVITSSSAAINRTITEPTHIFDESEWADEAVDLVREKGRDAAPMVKYRASKTLAERAAWDFYRQHKKEIEWDLIILNPPFIFGSPLQSVASPKELNTSAAIIFNMLTDPSKTDEELKATINFIDVRDISKAHVEALKNTQAAGQRMIISAGAATWQDLRNTAYSLRPDLYASGALPRGNPELDHTVLFVYNPEKGKKILGFEYLSKEEIVKDLLADYEARGWLKASV